MLQGCIRATRSTWSLYNWYFAKKLCKWYCFLLQWLSPMILHPLLMSLSLVLSQSQSSVTSSYVVTVTDGVAIIDDDVVVGCHWCQLPPVLLLPSPLLSLLSWIHPPIQKWCEAFLEEKIDCNQAPLIEIETKKQKFVFNTKMVFNLRANRPSIHLVKLTNLTERYFMWKIGLFFGALYEVFCETKKVAGMQDLESRNNNCNKITDMWGQGSRHSRFEQKEFYRSRKFVAISSASFTFSWFLKMGQTRPLFRLFSIFSGKQ